MKRKVMVPIVIVALIALDQWVKFEIIKNIQLGEVKPFLPKILSLTYLRNTGAAFSILENQQWLFAVITLVVIGAAIWYLSKHIKGSIWLLSSLSLIIAGGIGNFIDRMRQGFVVDMFQLDFINFAIFNVADSYLTIGVMVLVVMMLKEEDNASKGRN